MTVHERGFLLLSSPFSIFFIYFANSINDRNINCTMNIRQYVAFLCLVIIFIFSSCSVDSSKYRIGVSQCAGGEWREMQNKEMLIESTFYDNVRLEFRNASDNDSTQIKDIEYFINKKVDLLIVSPNTLDALNPVLKKAKDAGIPVVLFDRRVTSDNYSAFVGAENYDIGYQAGIYLGNRLSGKGVVLELESNMHSAPFRERHDGFIKAMESFPNIKVHSSLISYKDELAYNFVDSLLTTGFHIDGIYSHIDISCRPAYEALRKHNIEQKVAMVGIDGMPFKDCGIDCVMEKKQTATFVYPTGGDRIVQVAMSILYKKPFNKDNELKTYVIDEHNVRTIRAQMDELMIQNKKIERLYNQADRYLSEVHEGKYRLLVVVMIAALLGIIVFVLFHAYWMRNRLNHRLMKQNEKISQQKDMMKEQRDQLIEMSKQVEEATNAKLVFFTNVSHDFRTPLTLISGPLAQLKEHSKWNEPEEKLYNIIQKNIGVLLRLVNQIIDFRKFENGKMVLQSSHQNLESSIKEWGNAFNGLALEKDINFIIEVEDDKDYTIDFDVEKIESVFYNLTYNAFKFTPHGGTIKVELKDSDNVSMIQLLISDTGCGMSQENIQRVFDRFYKVDSHDSGSGIGLNLSKAFVELHGGSISVNSEEGKGTIFIIELPKVQSEVILINNDANEKKLSVLSTQEKAIIDNLEKDIRQQELKIDENSANDNIEDLILVIDDNSDIREYLEYLLSGSYRVILACDGAQGFEYASKYIPDAIICDIMMPIMDGLEFCKKVKEDIKTSHIPVMLLTACSLDEQRVFGYESGADSYISKPFTAELLLSRVKNLIDNRKRVKPNFVVAHSIPSDVKDPDMVFVRNFKEFIDKNIGDANLSMDLLGDELGMSRSQLYRKVKALLGTNPSDIIKDARMNKAKILLSSTDASINDIAYSIGFSSPAYFTKCYKDYFGELPKSKRNN